MKPWIFRTGSLGLVLFALPLITSSDVASQSAPTQPATNSTIASTVVAPTGDPAGDPSATPAPPPGAAARPLPSDVNPSGPAAEIVKLAQAGVNEDVLLAFVNNTTGAFNLGSQEIIYLNDLGVPDAVVKAMIQRDQALKAPTLAASPAPSAPPAGQAAPAPAAPKTVSDAPPPMAEAPTETSPPDAQPPDTSYADASYADFYNNLSPYGSWADVPDYGLCWQPAVVVLNAGWQPYCDHGRWLYTDCGWYWHSDYTWGSVAFHYGRWFRDPRRGWCWWPDRTWGPAWVSWRYDDACCGWAALPPGTAFRPGIGISAGLHESLGLSASSFTFVPWASLSDSHPAQHRLSPTQAASVFNQTTVINDIASGNNHTIINRGIAPEQVARITHREVPRFRIRDGQDGLGERFSNLDHTLIVNSQSRPQPVSSAIASRGSSSLEYNQTSTGVGPRSDLPRPNAWQNTQATRRDAQPLIVHGGYTPSSAASAGWNAAPDTRNVTVIGRSFAPPHSGNPYVAYNTGQAMSQPRYETPAVQNYTPQYSRYYAPQTQIYLPSASAPVPRYESRAPFYSYSQPMSYSQPARQESAPARAPQTSYNNNGSSRSGNNGVNH
jgi:hypothetical protein